MRDSWKAHLEAIRSAPDEPDAYLVFADVLQEEGNPWGQLIVMHHELEQRPGDRVLSGKADALIKKHKLAPATKPDQVRLDWQWGFIREARIYDPYHRHSPEIVKALAEFSTTAALQRLELYTHHQYMEGGVDQMLSGLRDLFPTASDVQLIPEVDLSREQVSRVPEDLDSVRWLQAGPDLEVLDACREVRWLDLGLHDGRRPPVTIASLPLERLELNWWSQLREIPPEVWAIETLGYIQMYDCTSYKPTMAEVNHLLGGFVRSKTPAAQRVIEGALLEGKTPDASREQLLAALDSSVKRVRTRALSLLAEQSPDAPARPIGTGSVVAILGRLNMDKQLVKGRLEALGAKSTTRVTARTTHVVLGDSPKGKQRDLPPQAPVLFERHLVQLGDHDGEGLAEALDLTTLSSQLRAGKGKTAGKAIGAAVEVLHKSGGVPRELLPELFWVVQNTEVDKKPRAAAKKLLAAYAPDSLKQAMSKHFKTSVLLAGETKRCERLTALARAVGSELDMVQLVGILIEDHGGGLLWAMEHGSDELLVAAIRKHVHDGALDLTAMELTALPDLSMLAGNGLTSLRAAGNHITKLPTALADLGLRKIDLSDNKLRTLPTDLSMFETTEELNLDSNRFSKFPRGVLTMPRLRRLDLSSHWYGSNEIREIPASINQLQTLEHLRIETSRGQTVRVPDSIAELPNLKVLAVSLGDERKRVTKLVPNVQLEEP